MQKVLLSWSSGKDSAWAFELLRKQPDLEVVALLTTFNGHFDRVAMHAVRRTLAEAQAEQLGLPLWRVDLPWPCPNTVYEEQMRAMVQRALGAGIECCAFGDLFLQDIRAYREKQLQGTGLTPLFPLWEIPTGPLARDMIANGIRAKITCVDPTKLDRSFAGRDFDADFLCDLPPDVDPCGENGEFHSFVYDSPSFASPIPITVEEIVDRDGFVFADLLPSAF